MGLRLGNIVAAAGSLLLTAIVVGILFAALYVWYQTRRWW